MPLAFDVAQANPEQGRGMRISVIVCAHNEDGYLPACLRERVDIALTLYRNGTWAVA